MNPMELSEKLSAWRSRLEVKLNKDEAGCHRHAVLDIHLLHAAAYFRFDGDFVDGIDCPRLFQNIADVAANDGRYWSSFNV